MIHLSTPGQIYVLIVQLWLCKERRESPLLRSSAADGCPSVSRKPEPKSKYSYNSLACWRKAALFCMMLFDINVTGTFYKDLDEIWMRGLPSSQKTDGCAGAEVGQLDGCGVGPGFSLRTWKGLANTGEVNLCKHLRPCYQIMAPTKSSCVNKVGLF